MKLVEVCEFIVDCPHSTAQDEGAGYALIRTPNIGKGRLILEGVHRVSKDVYDMRNARAIPQTDDIILAREAPVGNVAKILENQKVCLGQRTVLIRPDKSKVSPDYLTYYLLAPEQQHKLTSTANGATVAHLNMGNIRNLEIDLPSRSVQEKIASILSAYDDMIDNCKKQIALLEEAAQRLYREWFVDLHFPGHESTPISENGLPEGWSYSTLAEIADIVMGQSPASAYYNNDKIGLPFHQGVSLFGNIYVINDIYTSKWTKEAAPNSILFSVRAPVGRINLTSERVALGRGVASINHKRDLQPFLYHFLKYYFYKDNIMGNGTIFSSINKDQLKSVKILAPSDSVAMSFCKLVSKYDRQLSVIEKKLIFLIEARDMLLPRLISGQIEINA